MSDLMITVGGFAALLVILVVLRIATKNKIEIKTPDIVLALIPVALWLLVTGKIKAFEYGGLKIEAAFAAASQTEVAADLAELEPLPIEPIDAEAKGPVHAIPELLQRRSQALSFDLGRGAYAGPAIQEYLEELTAQPYLEYVVINEEDGAFFGLTDARLVAQRIMQRRLDPGLLARWLNTGDAERVAQALPGLIGRDEAVTAATERREALERMDELDAEVLPVVSEEGRFVGVIRRSRLTASMLIEITERLSQ